MGQAEVTNALDADQRPAGRLIDYYAIARLDHAIKHVFVIPGVILAFVLRPDFNRFSVVNAILILLSCVFSASANYVINEWLDAPFDRIHPKKSNRPCVARKMSPTLIYSEYLILAVLGLGAGYLVSSLALYTSIALLLSGLIYNVNPIRSKDVVFLDVLSEALNNPIRMVFGWAMVDPTSLPPSSLLLAYWMGGCFLMNTKRLAEYRDVSRKIGAFGLAQYRRSFRFYTEQRLLLASFLYAQMSIFGCSIFIIKYRIEYTLALPFVALLFCLYFRIGLKPDSNAQTPERLTKERGLMLAVGILVCIFFVLSIVNLPFLEPFMSARYIQLPN
ncbi:MAG TPA: UbiA family prenyltransferase [Stellaceae bacterium]|nr:UbiA family prenyltransferase [Stellaceae bacterium]